MAEGAVGQAGPRVIRAGRFRPSFVHSPFTHSFTLIVSEHLLCAKHQGPSRAPADEARL